MKLVQKKFLKGRREFEIVDDAVYVQNKVLLKQEKMTVALAMLDPEPVFNGSELEFHGLNKRGPLVSLMLDLPSEELFREFITTLQQRIRAMTIPLGEPSAEVAAEAPGWNVYEEPPGFDETETTNGLSLPQTIHPERIDDDIRMLKTYLDEKDIRAFLNALEALKMEPGSEVAFTEMVRVFNELEGFSQGAVLTYTNYLKVLLSQTISL